MYFCLIACEPILLILQLGRMEFIILIFVSSGFTFMCVVVRCLCGYIYGNKVDYH